MKKILLIFYCSIFFISIQINAQVNLVPNGDFEICISYPGAECRIDLAKGWNNVNKHYICSSGSPDYFNVISFYQPFGAMTPISGDFQAGFLTFYTLSMNWREYISTQLTNPFIQGRHYNVSFYISNGIDTLYTQASNNIGVLFSNMPLSQTSRENIAVIPQIEITDIIYFWNKWHHYSFDYIADSNYKFITIGNFKDDAHTTVSSFGKEGAYYFIDKIEVSSLQNISICKGNSTLLKMYDNKIANWEDVLHSGNVIASSSTLAVAPSVTTTYLAYTNSDSVYFKVNVINLPTINLRKDTTLCQGQSITLNATTGNSIYQWMNGYTEPIITATEDGIYSVKITDTITKCSITASVKLSCELEPIIPNIITPNGDGYNDKFVIENIQYWNINLQIYNRWGLKVYEDNNYQNTWDGKYKGNLLADGTYFYQITIKNKYTDTEKWYHGSLTILR